MNQTRLRPVNRDSPCDICGSDHKCSRGEDGLILCGRPVVPAPEGFVDLGASKGGDQWHQYRREDDPMLRRNDQPPRPTNANGDHQSSPPKATVDWDATAQRYADALPPVLRHELAVALGLPESAVAVSGVGWLESEEAWTFPERDHARRVVGMLRRFRDPGKTKMMMAGGNRGLTILPDWDRGGPIYLVEGPSDTLTAHAMELNVIGRPSNTGGRSLLAELLKCIAVDRPIVALGENDPKLNGDWPGLKGAKVTATSLQTLLSHPVQWALPPDGAKDVRDWASAKIGTNRREDADAWADAGAEFRGALKVNSIETAEQGEPAKSCVGYQFSPINSAAFAGGQLPPDLARQAVARRESTVYPGRAEEGAEDVARR